MALAPGNDPGLRDPQSLVLPLHYASIYWCPRSDSNRHCIGFEPTASANWATRA
jgi:hypothetical protein